MLNPQRLKYRRVHRGKMKGNAKGGYRLAFGDYGIKAMEHHWITSRQIEAARIAITRYLKREGKLWITIFPHKPVTKKPAETRMGKGKGAPDHYVAVVKPGRIMFELEGVSEENARKAFKLAARKLPIKVKMVTREMDGGMGL
ncbi:MAG: 50S ribosomal protein L16 [candidate division Zixibacteria bacterium 4484_93]|nr:MAG: 50S ribosomal protein L16 [candidate division Zixibacteria bacterium 4484_93]RKZ33581.1 MAG: 50S ribosomal protein L16 [bacterium]